MRQKHSHPDIIIGKTFFYKKVSVKSAKLYCFVERSSRIVMICWEVMGRTKETSGCKSERTPFSINITNYVNFKKELWM